MKNNFDLPMMICQPIQIENLYQDLQSMGFSRSMAYRLLQGDLIPVVCIGKRRFIRHETLLKWLAEQEQTSQSEFPADLKNEEMTGPDEDDSENDQLTFKEYKGGDEK